MVALLALAAAEDIFVYVAGIAKEIESSGRYSLCIWLKGMHGAQTNKGTHTHGKTTIIVPSYKNRKAYPRSLPLV